MILMALEDVQPGMALGRALNNREGHTLLAAGMVLTDAYITRLRSLGYWAVWIDDEETRDIVYQETVSDGTRLATTGALRETFMLTAHQVRDLRTASVQRIREALNGRRLQQSFQDFPALARLSSHVDAMVGEVLDRTVLTGLGALRSHDTYTFDHSMDVAVTGTMLGRLVGYDRETLKKLAVGCLLHDIGKIFVDDAVLNKRTPLTEEEMKRVREHAPLGYLFLRDTLRCGVLAAHVAYQHHERQDGTGYPRGLTGTNRVVHGLELHVPGRIHPMGEIAALADFHAACSADHPYRPAMPPDQVWQLIADGAGTHFNQEMVELFLKILPPFPIGTQIIVVTPGRWADWRGVVARVPGDAVHHPVIRLLVDDTGRRVDPVEIDLARTPIDIRSAIRPRGDVPTPISLEQLG
jgi:HD-GYP domain-containing protein (c-di-GMP phosphodiesterase class II)